MVSVLLLLCLIAGINSLRLRPTRMQTVRSNDLRIWESVEGKGSTSGDSSSDGLSEDVKLKFKAIRQYKEIYGNLAVDSTFVVPSADFSWPEDTWGLQLGAVVDKIKNSDDYDGYKAELEEIGFKYTAPAAMMSGLEDDGTGFDTGQIVTYGLYAWIFYLAVDTARIVFFTGSPPGQ